MGRISALFKVDDAEGGGCYSINDSRAVTPAMR